MIKIGGIEFLSQLKANPKVCDIPILDDIIDNLLKLNPAKRPLEDCDKISYSYNPKIYQNSALRKSEIQDNHQTIGYFNGAPSGAYNPPSDVKSDLTDIEQSYYPIILLWPESKFPHRLRYETVDPPDYPIDDGRQEGAQRISRVLHSHIDNYPIFIVTRRTLRSDDFRVVISGMQFFTDVILEDFPSPVFLQRQGVLKVTTWAYTDHYIALSFRSYCSSSHNGNIHLSLSRPL